MYESTAANPDCKRSPSNGMSRRSEIKPEPAYVPDVCECAACGQGWPREDTADAQEARTAGSGATLLDFLCRLLRSEALPTSARRVCRACRHLIDALDQAELDYLRLKAAFEEIIHRNPLLKQVDLLPDLNVVKNEVFDEPDVYDDGGRGEDSEDEPLAITKKKRSHKDSKRKKKSTSLSSKNRQGGDKTKSSRWKCEGAQECGSLGAPGAEPPTHSLHDALLKKEEDTGFDLENSQNQSPVPEVEATIVKLEPDFGDDASSESHPYEMPVVAVSKKPRKNILLTDLPKRERKKKVMHECDQCGAKFSALSRLSHHIARHEQKPPYICEVCGAKYKNRRACDIHVAMHAGISNWKCVECNKLFPSKGALARHNNIHTGTTNFQCDLCGKSFIHTSSFKMHKLAHTGVKPFKCSLCGLGLMTSSHLKRHQRIHAPSKRFECDLCGKGFNERYNLVAHARSHAAPPAPRPEEPAAEAAPRPAARSHFRCPFCTDRFERKYLLERHVTTVHGRTLERAPSKPRNTMSKLLKAKAAHCALNGDAASDSKPKEELRSPGAGGGAAAGAAADEGGGAEAREGAPGGGDKAPPAATILERLISHNSAVHLKWSAGYEGSFPRLHDYPQ